MRYVTILLLVLCFQKGICQKTNSGSTNKELILEVGYDYGGCEQCGAQTLTINKDSVIYIKGNSSEVKIKRFKNSPVKWNKLLKKIILVDFDKTPNGRPERATDGVDTQIYIKTSMKKHFMIVNYEVLNQFPSVKNFILELKSQLKIINENIARTK